MDRGVLYRAWLSRPPMQGHGGRAVFHSPLHIHRLCITRVRCADGQHAWLVGEGRHEGILVVLWRLVRQRQARGTVIAEGRTGGGWTRPLSRSMLWCMSARVAIRLWCVELRPARACERLACRCWPRGKVGRCRPQRTCLGRRSLGQGLQAGAGADGRHGGGENGL